MTTFPTEHFNVFPTIYKLDSKKRIREWRMEINESRYRTVAGLQDGKQVTSGWTDAAPKNTGKANSTTAEQQAIAEVQSQYKKKLGCDYHELVDSTDTELFFKPMLAYTWEKRKDKIDYSKRVFFQPKLDGIRCIASRHGVFSKTGKPIKSIPHVVQLLAPVFAKYPDVVLDGELYNHQLRDDFDEIVSMVKKAKSKPSDIDKSVSLVQFHVYDFPGVITDLFSDRIANLERLIDEFKNEQYDHNVLYSIAANSTYMFTDVIKLVPTLEVTCEQEVDSAYDTYMDAGYEGGIIRLNDKYHNKRTNSLIKRKDFEDAEFTIVRIEEGKGNWAGVAKRVIFINDIGGGEFGAGLACTKEVARQILKDADSYVGKKGTVQFFKRTPRGVPRHPIAKALHRTLRW
jgi:DNA ligase-1